MFHFSPLMLFLSLVKIATALALVAPAVASPIQQHHQHHQHEKRATVTNTIVVTVGGGSGEVATYSVAQPLSVATTQATASNGEIPTGTASSAVASSTGGSSGSSFSGAAKGITYSPYNADGTCKSSSDVASDISQLSSYLLIRLYGVDCNQVENVLAALADGQKIFAGIYFMDQISAGIQTLASAVKANGGWDVVHTVSIGNELVNGGSATPSQIQTYVQEGKSALTSAGYSGPVVSVDTFIAVINNPQLCQYSDYIAVNAHAFFDGYATAEEAGSWLLGQIQRVSSACGNSKSVFITETGWPTQGESNNVAVPSTSNQKAALLSISLSCGNDAIFFNAYNDLWKSPGAFNAEQFWGIYN